MPPGMHPYAPALFTHGDPFVGGHAYASSFISHLIRAEPYPAARMGPGTAYTR